MTTIDFHKTVTSQFRFAVVFARTMRLPCTAPGTGFELAMAPEPTVDDQGMPDDVARSGTAQPKHRRRDLVGLADSADGRGLWQRLKPFFRLPRPPSGRSQCRSYPDRARPRECLWRHIRGPRSASPR